MGTFDYRMAIEEDIVRFARALRGTQIGAIPGARFASSPPARGKGEVGLAIECYFGIPPNSRSEADFPGAGIELKIVPLVRSAGRLSVKERTSLTMIDYMGIIHETWETPHVRSKLRILFVYVEHLPGRPKAEFPIRQILLWVPSPRQEAFLRDDWQRVKAMVQAGRAHELRESDGRIMGPATKAATSQSRRSQPVARFSPVAKPRAFALRPSFTQALYDDSVGRVPQESLVENLDLADVSHFEEAVHRRFATFVGMTLGEAGRRLGVTSQGKGFIGAVLRLAFGATTPRARIQEFEEMGIALKATRVSPAGMPYEAMSFPRFSYAHVAEEEWETSTFRAQIQGLMIVPCVGDQKATPAAECVIRPPTLWKPSPVELDPLRAEWVKFRDEIRAGRADRLPPASTTRMIHVRPHARDSKDTEEAPGVGPVVKKSFWLNREFVAQLIQDSMGS